MALIRDHELRNLIIDGKTEEFNQLAAEGPVDLENVDLRGLDLKGLDLSHANLRGAYLRNTDARGIDLFYADLEGASLNQARIGGVRFPRNVTADEIRLSHDLGTRLRTCGPVATPPPASAADAASADTAATAADDGTDPAA